MAVRTQRNTAYGLSEALVNVPLLPIVSTRNPTASDTAALGQIWVNKSSDTFYVLTSIDAGVATWSTDPGAIVADLTVTNNLTVGNTATVANNITSTNGPITATAGNIIASAGDIVATLGDITATAGAITAGAGITASAGDITATTGDFVASAGDIVVLAGDITATNGDINATLGSVTAGATVTAGTSITAGTGITATTGNITATLGDIVATAGDIIATAGNISTTAGDIDSANNVTATGAVIAAGPVSGDFFVFVGGTNIQIAQGAGSPNGVATAPLGSLWIRTDPAGAASRLYINTDGGTTWANFTASA